MLQDWCKGLCGVPKWAKPSNTIVLSVVLATMMVLDYLLSVLLLVVTRPFCDRIQPCSGTNTHRSEPTCSGNLIHTIVSVTALYYQVFSRIVSVVAFEV